MASTIVPLLPFENFKWKWACLQCTEGINDPVVLLGVLFRMAKLEGRYRYSSQEFADELISLSDDLIGTGVNVDLRGRTGERNIIRNSGQYWKALNLIPSTRTSSGLITLTDFGRRVANHTISQTEFSAHSIISFKLPNRAIQSEAECKLWENAGLELYPLKLLLQITKKLGDFSQAEAYITCDELTRIIIPLSGVRDQKLDTYVGCILESRAGLLSTTSWPNCCQGANDFRIAREFLLFLSNYGYLIKNEASRRENERYYYNYSIDLEIQGILKTRYSVIDTDIISDTERKLVYSSSQRRPNQAKFRKAVLDACPRCVITNVQMPEVLEAAHIKPYKYKGEDTAANGFAMRMDIHYLFDSGHLRISEDGDVFLSDSARWSYGASIPPRIFIPDHINREFIRWRWDNYNGV